LNALERVEARAAADLAERCGGRAGDVGGALCFAQPTIPGTELNRAIPLADEVDLDAVAEWFAGDTHDVVVTPKRPSLAPELADRGYTHIGSWMKFERGAEPVVVPTTDLVVRETTDPAPFALAAGEGYGIPEVLRPLFASVVGAPGWRCFVAWAGGEPAGAGAVCVDGEEAWCGIGATRPAFRRRGAQAAVLAARIEAAIAAGAGTLAVETGQRAEQGPNASYRNILRAGFREAYLRENWRSPA
jgi:GNAT superfamily N-acetyltransferase